MRLRKLIVPLAVLVLAAGCAQREETPTETPAAPSEAAGEITVYSGRSEELVAPVIEKFEAETGITVSVSYKDTAELAAQIMEEGDRSPADVFFAQDAGALGAVAAEGLFADLDDEVLQSVPDRFRSPEGQWVGISGRARVAVYNTENVQPSQVPTSVEGFTEPRWRGKVGWAPSNGSFQAFVTALRELEGEEAARTWLEEMKANGTKVYEKNSAIVQAVAAGEIDAGLVNHYYLLQLGSEDPSITARASNHFFSGGPGSLINVAGAGILETSDNKAAAQRFLEYLLSEEGQTYFATETFEYPLVEGVQPSGELPPLNDLRTPELDLSDLDDLRGTLELLRSTGALDA